MSEFLKLSRATLTKISYCGINLLFLHDFSQENYALEGKGKLNQNKTFLFC